ncbi:MAG: AcrR family transcriptional regulator [Myxococcota bacterium]|jgi:AcrR family transcriptional regulator
MARPREFDTDQALERALEVFWAQGFEATSVTDLKGAMGIETGSLYKAFGNKRALYVAAVERYIARGERFQMRLLASKEPISDGIAQLFEAIVEIATDPSGRGCFVVNCAIEHGATDAEIQSLLGRQEAALSRYLRDRIAADQTKGLVPSVIAADALASYVSATIGGIQVLAKKGASKQTLSGVAQAALQVFRLTP